MAAFGELEVVPAREAPGLELIEFHAATVPPRIANALMGRLAEAAPLEGCKHVKRVRKTRSGSEPVLEILLAAVQTSSSADSPVSLVTGDELAAPACSASLPAPLQAVIDDFHLATSLRQVPKHSPVTREQWAEWTQLWPLYWNAPSCRAAEPEVQFSKAEEASIQKWMRVALSEAAAAEASGCAENAAVFVDPATDSIVAVGRDGSAESPLQHAVIAAIEVAAAENLRLWPEGEAATELGDACRAPEKRLKPEGCADVSQSRQLLRTRAAPAAKPRQYLCTGLDCIVVREPCAMCAMALVHSRLRRVVYCRRDPVKGALGGSFKLHAERSLNHHYLVVHLPLR